MSTYFEFGEGLGFAFAFKFPREQFIDLKKISSLYMQESDAVECLSLLLSH